MPNLLYLRHVSAFFAALLAVSVLYGIARAAERGLSRNQRVLRGIRTPLLFFVVLTGLAHAASYVPTSSFAMTLAVVSPAHRAKVARALRPRVLGDTKSDELVLGLIELDRLAFGCNEALADASNLRARGAWARLDEVCGPSIGSAIAAYQEGRLADAAATFAAVRARSASNTKVTTAELATLLLLDRRREALDLLRSEKRAPGPDADSLGCLEDALALHVDNRTGPVRRALDAACSELGAAFEGERPRAPVEPVEPRNLCTRHRRPRSAPPCVSGCFETKPPDPMASLRTVAGSAMLGRDRLAKADWLLHAGRAADALPLLDAELLTLGTGEPLYPAKLVAEREAFLDRVGLETPGAVIIAEDCSTQLTLPESDARTKEARAFAARFDESRDLVDRGRLETRDQVLVRAAMAALDLGDLARAEAYLARRTNNSAQSSTLALRHAFSSDAAREALYGGEREVLGAATVGDGAAMVKALRTSGGSGVGTIDVVGAAVPSGQAELRAYSRHEARLICYEGIDRILDCGPGALVVALAGRARVARAVGDDRTANEATEAVSRLLAAPAHWTEDRRVFTLTRAAQRIFGATQSPHAPD